LTHDQTYWKTVSYADGEEETWLFIQNGQGFYCGKTESAYLLTLSAVSLGEEMFAFPPMKNTDVGDSIEINYTWEEFSDFFRSIDGATVSDGFVTTTLYGGIGAEAIGIASLTYRDGTVQVSVSQNS
jgi:hypothetical protein